MLRLLSYFHIFVSLVSKLQRYDSNASVLPYVLNNVVFPKNLSLLAITP